LLTDTLLDGMELLYNVTGIEGLPARSVCDPIEKHVSCANGSWLHDKTQWINSSAPGYSGWIWKSDTSSDEIVGHVFSLLLVATLEATNDAHLSQRGVRAATLLVKLVKRIVDANFTLPDYTGKPTTWGRWDPHTVNGDRAFSDERGLQSLQMLSFLSAAANASRILQQAGLVDIPPQSFWWDAASYLQSDSVQYNLNLRNVKILWPLDDNFSDDQLAWLSLFSLLWSCPQGSECSVQARIDLTSVYISLDALAHGVDKEWSSLWSALQLVLLPTAISSQGAQTKSALTEALSWNLQTWPVEQVQWPTRNSVRADLVYERGADRFGRSQGELRHTWRPLPAYERRQSRWNADPWDVTDGWDGMTESDPGAWLLPYWLGRYAGVIRSTD